MPRELNIFLTNVNPQLKDILLDGDHHKFKDLRQSYVSIREAIFNKRIEDIQEAGLTYNLVQAVHRGDCDVYDAADIILFYLFMKKIKNGTYPHDFDWRDTFYFAKDTDNNMSIIGSHHEESFSILGLSFFRLTQVARKAILEDGYAKKLYDIHKEKIDETYAFVLFSLKTLNSDISSTPVIQGFPVLHGFNTVVLANAVLVEGRRYITFPKFLPESIKQQFQDETGVLNLRSVHEGLHKGYLAVALHDYGHVLSERMLLCELPLRHDLYQLSINLSKDSRFKKADREMLIKFAADIADIGVLATLTLQKEASPYDIIKPELQFNSFSATVAVTILKELFHHANYDDLPDEWHDKYDGRYRQDYMDLMISEVKVSLPREHHHLMQQLIHNMDSTGYTIHKKMELIEQVYRVVVYSDLAIKHKLYQSMPLNKLVNCLCFCSIFSIGAKPVERSIAAICQAIDEPQVIEAKNGMLGKTCQN